MECDDQIDFHYWLLKRHWLHGRETIAVTGYQVIASCRDAQDVARLSQENLTCIQLDLSSEASINQAVEQALELSNHRLYVLFINGAYGQPAALEDLPVQAMREQFEDNFLAGII